MAAVAILDFKIFEILMVGQLKRAEVCRRANLFEIGQTTAEI